MARSVLFALAAAEEHVTDVGMLNLFPQWNHCNFGLYVFSEVFSSVKDQIVSRLVLMIPIKTTVKLDSKQ